MPLNRDVFVTPGIPVVTSDLPLSIPDANGVALNFSTWR
jgi:hypothetical protein